MVNIVTENLTEAMNLSSLETSPDVNEFELAGLTLAPSIVVKAPRVAESPIHFECQVRDIIEINNQPGGGYVVTGTVVYLHVDDGVLLGTGKIDLTALKPIGRLARGAYVRMTDLFKLDRPQSQLKKK